MAGRTVFDTRQRVLLSKRKRNKNETQFIKFNFSTWNFINPDVILTFEIKI